MKPIILIFLTILTGCSIYTPPEPKQLYDIPALIGKSIDETREILSFEEQVDPVDDSITKASDSYEVEKHSLLINYNPQTRKVTGMSLIFPDGYEREQDILQVGNLNYSGMNYRCEIGTDQWSFSSTPLYNSVKIKIEDSY